LLGLLLAQAVSGLFNADTEGTRAPYHHLLSEQQANWIGLVHQLVFDALLVLVALHLLAVAFHTRFRNEPLLAAMIRGRATNKNGEAAPLSWGRALTVMLVSAGAVAALVYYAPKPPVAVYF
jgi:cytochrome b